MLEIIWDNTIHSVGHSKLDQQHQFLFSLINQLSVQASFDHDQSDVKGYTFILSELMKYIDIHLDYEEKLLDNIGYNDLVTHKEYHQVFFTTINAYSLDNTDADKKTALVEFLLEWWEEHILVEDMKYKPYLQKSSD